MNKVDGSRLIAALGIAALGLLAWSCANTRIQGGSSESHFLQQCEQGCGELHCLCGVCTDACQADSECRDLSEHARCLSARGGCGLTGDQPGLCAVECESTSDCIRLGSGAQCTEGRCALGNHGTSVTPDTQLPGSGALMAGGSAGCDQECGPPSQIVAGATLLDCDPQSQAPLQERPGETCYDLEPRGQDGQRIVLDVDTGESYRRIYYDVPWPTGTTATRFRTEQLHEFNILHDWQLFEIPAGEAPGPAVVDSVQGLPEDHERAFAAWGVGRCDLDMPPSVALRLPEPERGLVAIFHYYNASGSAQRDDSVIRVCTVPAGTREYEAGGARLGTIAASAAATADGDAMAESIAVGRCTNDATVPITVMALWPQIHVASRQSRLSARLLPESGVDPLLQLPTPHGFEVVGPKLPTTVLAPGDGIETACQAPTGSLRCFLDVLVYPADTLGQESSGGRVCTDGP